MSSNNTKNELSIHINNDDNVDFSDLLPDEGKLKKNENASDIKGYMLSEDLLKPEGNSRISKSSTRDSLNAIENDMQTTTKKEHPPLIPSKTEIDQLITNIDDSTSILLTITPIDDVIDDEIVSEVDDDMNEFITPIPNESYPSKKNKSINSLSIKDKINNDSFSIHTEEGLTSKTNSQNQINSSKSDIDGGKAEKNLKVAIDKELSFNYIDENEKLFSTFINKETLVKEYLDIRKRIEKFMSVSEQNKGLDLYKSDEMEDPLGNNDTTEKDVNINQTNDNSITTSNNLSPIPMTNSDIKEIVLLFDKFMEKIIENEK
ncbi:hypothetical protein PIROE2DRAFT_5069, partial [Piromyces sp. E2]